MTIITTSRDLGTYLADARYDLSECERESARLALQSIDHPAWGSDWSEWLDEQSTQRVIDVAAGLISQDA